MKILSIFTTETIKVQDVFGAFMSQMKKSSIFVICSLEQVFHKLETRIKAIIGRAPPVRSFFGFHTRVGSITS